MRYLHLSADHAYQYVKQRRSQISPNFNFLGQLSEYERNLSITSTTTQIVKCVAIETPLNDRRHFIQVEGSSNTDEPINHRTNVLSRPKSLLSPSCNLVNLSIELPQQHTLLTRKLLRPNNISLKGSTLELTNSNYDELKDNKPAETVSKSKDTSSINEPTDLINTYFQESTSSKSLPDWKSAQSLDSTNETTTANALSSSLELLIS